MFKFSIILTALFCTAAFSFPELVRYSYNTCTACHYDPQGGGILTQYGRGASVDLLSTFGTENEIQYPFPEWLAVGGDLRVVQTKHQTDQYDREKFLLMQADLIAALNLQPIKLVASLGHELNSRVHYLLFQPTENLSLRIGKFKLPYGINFPNHKRLVKRSLGLYENQESYQIEAYAFNDYAEFSMNLNLLEEGSTVKASALINDSFKIGTSYYPSKKMAGPFALIGLSNTVSVLSEADLVFNDFSVVTSSKLSYEVHKGINIYAIYERDSERDIYGIGFNFFPRPRFEIEGEYQKISDGDGLSDYGFLMGHFYL